MIRFILFFTLAVTRLMSQENTVFETSLKEGMLCIDRNDIHTAMNCLRRSINCFGIEAKSGTGDLESRISRLAASEIDHPKKGAYLVYAAVVEIANGPDHFDSAMDLLNSAQLEDPTLPEIYNTRGVILYYRQKWEAALVDYSMAIDLNPRYVDAIRNRSDVYRRLGKPNLAVSDFARYQDLLNSLYYPE